MSVATPALTARNAWREWTLSAAWPWSVLGAALALTLVASFMAQRAVEARQGMALRAAIEADMGALHSRMATYVALLRGTRAFVSVEGPALDHGRFHDYVSRLNVRRDYPSVQGIGYSPRVDPARVAEFEAAARREGLDGFSVMPPGWREWTFSILYLEPLDERNRAALGYDMFSEPRRAEAMARARDSGNVAMTGRVTLRQEIEPEKKAGFLIFKPIYGAGPEPGSVQERRQRLLGFVYAPLRAPDFFRGLFSASAPLAHVRVYAAAKPDVAQLLHDAQPQQPGAPGAGLLRGFSFGGQPWTVEFVPLHQASSEALLPPATALAGTGIALLLFFLTRSQLRARRRTEAIAQARSRALEGERAQRHLAESLSEIALALGSEPDVDELLQRLTDEATRLTGAAFGAYFHNQPDAGGHFGLYTLSGSDIEAFRRFPPVRATALFGATFEGRTVRLDDVRRSPLFGRNPPYHGMPEGHPPVVSYLGAGVRTRAGRVLGALLLGHPEPGRFQAGHERLVEGLAAQAGVVLENLQLLQREREARERAEAQKARLDAVNKELDQFAYVTSHDLKAPLRGIANLAQWIQEDLGEQGEQIAQYTRLLQGRVHRMEALIDGILQYSRAGRVLADPVQVDVGELLREVVELLAPPPGMRIEIVPPMPVVLADRTALQQVFMNLVGNALKHAAGERGEVRVAARDDGRCWEFSVADNGPGIPAQYQERIWAIFQTLEARDKVEGTGIGLSIVRKTVEARGGRAWVVSAEGAGATFFFTWPKQLQQGMA